MTPSLTDPPTPQRFFRRPARSLRPSSSSGTSATVVTALPRRPLVSRRTFTRPPAARRAFRPGSRALRRSPSSLDHTTRVSRVRFATRSRSGEGRPAAAQRRVGVGALDARLEVEPLLEVRVLADELAGAAGERLPAGLLGLPQVDRAPAVALLVGDPHLEAQARDLAERVDRLLAQVLAHLRDRRLRPVELPPHDTHAHGREPTPEGASSTGPAPTLREWHDPRPSSRARPAARRARSGTGNARAAASGTRWSRSARPRRARAAGAAAPARRAPASRPGPFRCARSPSSARRACGPASASSTGSWAAASCPARSCCSAARPASGSPRLRTWRWATSRPRDAA